MQLSGKRCERVVLRVINIVIVIYGLLFGISYPFVIFLYHIFSCFTPIQEQLALVVSHCIYERSLTHILKIMFSFINQT